jgi:hypothetical protein
MSKLELGNAIGEIKPPKLRLRWLDSILCKRRAINFIFSVTRYNLMT